MNLGFALAFGALLLFSHWTGAQVAGGLHGTIRDPSGAPVSNAHISIRNLTTNNATALATDARGFYSASDVPPGNYFVTVSMTGFLDVTASVAVTSGNQSVVNLTLQPANNQPGYKTPATSSMGGVVSSETVRDMPVNGRDWTQAATLQAGVSPVRTQPDATNTSSGRGQRGFGAQISVSGGRPQQNNYLLDGITINDYANAAPGSVLGLDLGADAVEASTGSPFTVTIGGDPLGLNSTDPYDVPIRLTGGTCKNPINAGNPADYVKLECFAFPSPPTLRGNTGRNSIIGPGVSNFDLSVLKNTYMKKIADRFNAQLRIEIFNAFNHANFAPPLDHHAVFDELGNPVSGAGLINSTQTPSRQVQLGLKLIW